MKRILSILMAATMLSGMAIAEDPAPADKGDFLLAEREKGKGRNDVRCGADAAVQIYEEACCC